METGRTQKIATHSAASSAARGEHRRKNGRGSYKSWALNDDHPKLFRGQAAGRPTPSFTEKWSREKGSYLGRPHETGPAGGCRGPLGSDAADRVGRQFPRAHGAAH